MSSPVLDLRAGWPLYAGMSVAGAAAVVASASTLAALARTAGWVGGTPWLLPASLDVGGSVGGWVWLRPGAPQRARRAGRGLAVAGAVASLVGNGAGHLITTGYVRPGPVLVVIVGAVPAAILVALAHLAALLAHPADEQPARTPSLPDTPVVEALVVERPVVDVHRDDDRGSGEAARTGLGDDAADTRAAVLAAIRARPATVADLVKATGRSRTTVVGHLAALTEAGTVARDDDKRYRPSTGPRLAAASVTVEEAAS